MFEDVGLQLQAAYNLKRPAWDNILLYYLFESACTDVF